MALYRRPAFFDAYCVKKAIYVSLFTKSELRIVTCCMKFNTSTPNHSLLTALTTKQFLSKHKSAITVIFCAFAGLL